ncbi:hypothetical protein [Treponema sp. J25]|uniref:hypothetical protein n=1 Tax=Treponema sp. J25 TaxID=2094121 RepID=UPI00104DFAA5|nr:hypothetical protein [Treponema sp. J25]
MKKSPFAKKSIVRLLVLIPHPDIQRIARQYSGELLRAGWKGARLFPPVIPLAVLDKPIPLLLVQKGAHNLAFIQNQEAGTPFFYPRRWESLAITPFLHIGGISFSLPPIEKWLSPGLYQQGLSPLLALSLCTQAAGKTLPENLARRFDTSLSQLRFRAAALANCVIHLSQIPGQPNAHARREPAEVYFNLLPPFSVEQPEERIQCSYSSRWIIGKPCWLPKKPSIAREFS